MINFNKSKPLKVLHYVKISLPQQSGYSLRTHNIAIAQSNMGHTVGVCSGVGSYTSGTSVENYYNQQPVMKRDGIPYLTYTQELYPKTVLYSCVKSLFRKRVPGIGRLRKKLDIRKCAAWLGHTWCIPDVVHAHSTAMTGRDGFRLARYFSAYFVYEIRGFWNLSNAVEKGEEVNVKRLCAPDISVARKADRVVAICQGIANELIRGGVPEEKIVVVPNGVNCSAFRPLARNQKIVEHLGLKDHFVFGYVTNVRRLEGIQTVIKSWAQVKKAIPNALFVLVGDGAYLDTIKNLAKHYKVENSFRFVGRVAHEDILSYYSLIDVFVVPRIPEHVCEIVTPLKPLEAMALGIPVIASDVGGLSEIVMDRKTGVLFHAGSTESLASACIRVASDSDLRSSVSEHARQWVAENRDWNAVISRYEEVYRPANSV